jgi:hypothetical protein
MRVERAGHAYFRINLVSRRNLGRGARLCPGKGRYTWIWPAIAGQPALDDDTSETQLNAESPRLNLGASFNKGTETSVLPLAPIEKDQLELSWKPGGKWGITLDLTSRSENDILPKEEFAAGLSYQVTPRFRFGGGVTLKGDSLSKPMTTFKDEVSETTVRVESAFSF